MNVNMAIRVVCKSFSEAFPCLPSFCDNLVCEREGGDLIVLTVFLFNVRSHPSTCSIYKEEPRTHFPSLTLELYTYAIAHRRKDYMPIGSPYGFAARTFVLYNLTQIFLFLREVAELKSEKNWAGSSRATHPPFCYSNWNGSSLTSGRYSF